ncbi:unnamed protein product, partial [Owenia fusiformis]
KANLFGLFASWAIWQYLVPTHLQPSLPLIRFTLDVENSKLKRTLIFAASVTDIISMSISICLSRKSMCSSVNLDPLLRLGSSSTLPVARKTFQKSADAFTCYHNIVVLLQDPLDLCVVFATLLQVHNSRMSV